jgi:hypothetical protein
MSKQLLSLILLLFMTATVSSQEEAAEDAPAAEETPAAEEVAEPAVEEPNDDDLDLQTYEEDDDDFVPTEEIPADVPIPFPSNI